MNNNILTQSFNLDSLKPGAFIRVGYHNNVSLINGQVIIATQDTLKFSYIIFDNSQLDGKVIGYTTKEEYIYITEIESGEATIELVE